MCIIDQHLVGQPLPLTTIADAVLPHLQVDQPPLDVVSLLLPEFDPQGHGLPQL